MKAVICGASRYSFDVPIKRVLPQNTKEGFVQGANGSMHVQSFTHAVTCNGRGVTLDFSFDDTPSSGEEKRIANRVIPLTFQYSP